LGVKRKRGRCLRLKKEKKKLAEKEGKRSTEDAYGKRLDIIEGRGVDRMAAPANSETDPGGRISKVEGERLKKRGQLFVQKGERMKRKGKTKKKSEKEN